MWPCSSLWILTEVYTVISEDKRNGIDLTHPACVFVINAKVSNNVSIIIHMNMSSETGNSSDFNSTKKGRLNDYVSKAMQKHRVPGLSLTIVREGKILYSRGYGHRDLENRKIATENTLYGVGSVTKSFTALAVMQLREKGLLKTDDPITDYIKAYRVDDLARETTISHLLSHTSGMPSLNVAEIVLFRDLGTDTSSIPISGYDDFFDLINGSSEERHSSPGNKLLYWNEGYTILGKLVEELSGKSYSHYVQENILTPLGMQRSVFTRKNAMADKDNSTPYYKDKDGNNRPSSISDDTLVLAPGGLISSSLELSRYLGLWTGRNGRKSDLLSAEGLEELIKPRIKSSFAGLFGPTYYGYGWMRTDNFLGKTLIMHSGSVAASSGFVGFLPHLRAGVSIGANTSDAPTTRVGMYALALLMNDDAARELPFVRLEKTRERLKGEYTDYRGYTGVKIDEGADGLLNMSIDSNEYHMTIPIIMDGDGFYTVIDDARLDLEIRFKGERGVEIYFERHRFAKK